MKVRKKRFLAVSVRLKPGTTVSRIINSMAQLMEPLTFLVFVVFFTCKRGKKTCNKRAVSLKYRK